MSKKAAHDAADGTKGKSKHSSASKKPTKKKRVASSKVERAEAGKFAPGNANAFKPGESGNPAGRPKHRTLSEAIRDKLKQETGLETDETWADLIAERLVRVAAGMSLENSTNAAKEIGDRTEGKARQPIDLDPTDDAKRLLANILGRDVSELPAPRKDS
jgi:hypothetical protein